MTQYCRYCANFVVGDCNWCTVFHITPTDEFAKRPNKCKKFVFNEIDAFGTEHIYQPRQPKEPEPEVYVGNLFEEQ